MPSITLTKAANTILTLLTQRKYVPDNIAFTINAQTDNPTFSGGNLSGIPSISTQNITLTSTNTSGIQITPICTSYMTDVLYASNVNGWVEKTSGDTAVTSSFVHNAATPQYITEVMVDNSKSFTVKVPANNVAVVGTAQIDISTIGDYGVLGFSVDANGVTTITGLADADGVSY